METLFLRCRACCQWSCWLLAALALQLTVRADQIVYDDALQNGWQNWGWATLNYANTSPIHSGADSISVSSTGNQALYLHHTAMSGPLFTNLTFWINGGSGGGQVVQVQATINGAPQAAVVLAALPASSWRQQTISLAALGVAASPNFDGFWIQVQNSGLAPTFYVDDISLTTNAIASGTNANVTVQIDALANRHAISPLIYGVAFAASSSQLQDLNTPLHRSGGNAETRYNWQINATSHAADWYFESIADANTVGGDGDDFIQESKNAGAQAM